MSVIPRAQLREGAEVNVLGADLVGTYGLRLTFSDQTQTVIDFEPFLRSSGHPQVRAYLDPELFARFEVRDGDLVWGDYELCFPIADLYEGRI